MIGPKLSDYVENMSIDRLGRFFSPAKREVEFLRYPFTLTSQISGTAARIKDRDELLRFLIAHKDAGASFDIGGVLNWVDDQSAWSGHEAVNRHTAALQGMDESMIYLG